MSPHPDLCPYCRAPISPERRALIGGTGPCTCSRVFGAVTDPKCPKHGRAAPSITGATNIQNIR